MIRNTYFSAMLLALFLFLQTHTASANSQYDLVVVGSGPGGLTAAIAAIKNVEKEGGVLQANGKRRKLRVGLFDIRDRGGKKSAFSRQQIVGIKESSINLLNRLGVKLPANSKARMRSVEVSGDGTFATPSPLKAGDTSTNVLKIGDLQRTLEKEARAAGVELSYGTGFEKMRKSRDGKVRVVISKGGTEKQITTKYIVGGDGAGSKVRKEAGFELQEGKRHGVMVGAWFSGVTGTNRIIFQEKLRKKGTGVLIGESKEMYGLFPLPKSISDKIDPKKPSVRLNREIKTHVLSVAKTLLSEKEGKMLRLKKTASFPIQLNKVTTAVKDNTILIGDAVQTVNPLSGSGANIAMIAGGKAGEAIAEALSGKGTKKLIAYNRFALKTASKIHAVSRGFRNAFTAKSKKPFRTSLTRSPQLRPTVNWKNSAGRKANRKPSNRKPNNIRRAAK